MESSAGKPNSSRIIILIFIVFKSLHHLNHIILKVYISTLRSYCFFSLTIKIYKSIIKMSIKYLNSNKIYDSQN